MGCKVIQFTRNKTEDVLVTLVENICDENGKVMRINELDDNSLYCFQIRKENGVVINYPRFKALSKDINEEILLLKEIGISGEYFVSPIKRRKRRW